MPSHSVTPDFTDSGSEFPKRTCYNRLMRRPLLAAAVAVIGLTALISSIALANAQANSQKDAPAQESAPDVPDAIAVPAGQQIVFFVHAKGSQIYTCQAPERSGRGFDRSQRQSDRPSFRRPNLETSNLEAEGRQRSYRQSSRPRRLARLGFHSLAVSECREPRRQVWPANQRHHNSTRTHARRKAQRRRRLRWVAQRHGNEK